MLFTESKGLLPALKSPIVCIYIYYIYIFMFLVNVLHDLK